MGAKIYRDEQPTPGFAVGQSVPASTPIEAVRGTPEHHVGFTFGACSRTCPQPLTVRRTPFNP